MLSDAETKKMDEQMQGFLSEIRNEKLEKMAQKYMHKAGSGDGGDSSYDSISLEDRAEIEAELQKEYRAKLKKQKAELQQGERFEQLKKVRDQFRETLEQQQPGSSKKLDKILSEKQDKSENDGAEESEEGKGMEEDEDEELTPEMQDERWKEFERLLFEQKPKHDVKEAQEEVMANLKKASKNIFDQFEPDESYFQELQQEVERSLPKHSDPKVEVLITRIENFVSSEDSLDDAEAVTFFENAKTLSTQYVESLTDIEAQRIFIAIKMFSIMWRDANKTDHPSQIKGSDIFDLTLFIKNAFLEKSIALSEDSLGRVFQIAILTLDRENFERNYTQHDITRFSWINDPKLDSDIVEAVNNMYPTPEEVKPPPVRPSIHGMQIPKEQDPALEEQLRKFELACQSFRIEDHILGEETPLDQVTDTFIHSTNSPLKSATSFARVLLAIAEFATRLDNRYATTGKEHLSKHLVGKVATQLYESMLKGGIPTNENTHAAYMWALSLAQVESEEFDSAFEAFENPNVHAHNAAIIDASDLNDVMTLYNFLKLNESAEMRPNLKTYELVLTRFTVVRGDPAEMSSSEFKESGIGEVVSQQEAAELYKEDMTMLRKTVRQIYRDLKQSGLSPDLQVVQALALTLIPEYRNQKDRRKAASVFVEQLRRDFPHIVGMDELRGLHDLM